MPTLNQRRITASLNLSQAMQTADMALSQSFQVQERATALLSRIQSLPPSVFVQAKGNRLEIKVFPRSHGI